MHKALLIGGMILPAPEVADVTLVAQLACPGLWRLHQRVIDADERDLAFRPPPENLWAI
jgi:hypothetical protein